MPSICKYHGTDLWDEAADSLRFVKPDFALYVAFVDHTYQFAFVPDSALQATQAWTSAWKTLGEAGLDEGYALHASSVPLVMNAVAL